MKMPEHGKNPHNTKNTGSNKCCGMLLSAIGSANKRIFKSRGPWSISMDFFIFTPSCFLYSCEWILVKL